MKELSIEEKAKAYDEAIAHAKLLLKTIGNATLGNLVLKNEFENMFPELKESEDENADEKVRKALIKLVTNHASMDLFIEYDIHLDEALSWLEKQGKNNMGISESAKQKLEDNLNKALEKETPESWNEFLDEQKPADKVEPKFKDGDWVVDENDNCVHQIERVIENVTNNKISYDLVGGGYFPSTKKNYHLWTIKDAKEGDVLSYRDGQWIFIYKGIVTEDTFKYYALLSEKGITVNDAAFSLLASCIIPATKEQCNLLFQKMKKAGYVWDAERKELKKTKQEENVELTDFESALFSAFSYAWQEYLSGKEVNVAKWARENSAELLEVAREQKPTCAWSKEDERNIRDSIFYLKSAKKYFEKDDDILWDEKWFNLCIKWLESLYKRPQPQQQWSKEDETYLDHIITAIKSYYTDDKGKENPWRNELLRWLESLKDRVQPQPKQEWGEEDEYNVAFIVETLLGLDGDKEYSLKYKSMANWLKSLRPQNWTKEDKERYISCLQRLSIGNPEQPETINSKWFKEHVYPNNRWKPSEEQIKILNEVLNFAANHESPHWNDYIFGTLNNLIRQLKKLKS